METIIVCCGFHRSATSVTSQWLRCAGVNMGNWLMQGAASNPEGHFEHMPFVSLNNSMLELQNTSWHFHDEVALVDSFATTQYQLYVRQRDRIHKGLWGVKDPRLCLFLPEWHAATTGRSKYVFVIRPWKECVKSLLKRSEGTNSLFEQNRDVAAKMWYSYNKRILDFVHENMKDCIVVSQSQLSDGYPLLEVMNDRFELQFDKSIQSPFKQALVNEVNSGDFSFLSEVDQRNCDGLWRALEGLSGSSARAAGVFSSDNVTPAEAKWFKVQDVKRPDIDLACLFEEESLNSQGVFKRWLDQAREEMRLLNWSVAERILEWLCLYSELPPYGLVMLAATKYKLDKKTEAVLLYKKAIGKNQNKQNFYLQLGQLYLNEGDKEKAKNIFSEGIHNNLDDCRWLKQSLELC